MTRIEFKKKYDMIMSYSVCCAYLLESKTLPLWISVDDVTNGNISGRMILDVNEEKYRMRFKNGTFELLSFIIDNLMNDNKDTMYKLLESCSNVS